MTDHKPVELSALRLSINNIISTMPLVCVIIVGWFNMDKRQTLSEASIAEHTKLIQKLVETQSSCQRTADRISFIVDEMLRQNAWGGSGRAKIP